MLKRQYWGVTTLFVTVAFSYIGYRLNDRHPSLPWMMGGLAAGAGATVVLYRVGKE
ncbi:hypothetical protein [Streptomyces sp. NPDC002845]